MTTRDLTPTLHFYGAGDKIPCLHCSFGSTGMFSLIDAKAAHAANFTPAPVEDGYWSWRGVETLYFIALVPGIRHRTGKLADYVLPEVKAELERRCPNGFTVVDPPSFDLPALYTGDTDTYVVGLCVVDYVRNK